MPNWHTGVQPLGIFPLLTKLPIFLMVMTVLLRGAVDASTSTFHDGKYTDTIIIACTMISYNYQEFYHRLYIPLPIL